MEPEIKLIRHNLGMTQKAFSTYLDIPLKTIRNWEQGIRRPSDWMLSLIIDKALDFHRETAAKTDESHGILSYLQIKNRVFEVAEKYRIGKVTLFGSYAKGEATETSDVDLFIDSEIEGLSFFGLTEEFRETLRKNVDLLSPKTVISGSAVDREIKDTGIPVYER